MPGSATPSSATAHESTARPGPRGVCVGYYKTGTSSCGAALDMLLGGRAAGNDMKAFGALARQLWPDIPLEQTMWASPHSNPKALAWQNTTPRVAPLLEEHFLKSAEGYTTFQVRHSANSKPASLRPP